MGKNKLIYLLIWLPIIFLGLLNLLTVFTPEIGFDALWYHLTLPKLFLFKRQWFFDGGLLYYSVMPRLTETIFIPLIKFTGYIGPKFIQYLSGIGISINIWKTTSRLKYSTILKSVSVSLFYCTWLVSWQSGSAYIDLFRTFLETVALYFFVSGSWKKGGMFLGLAVGTKWLALSSVGIYTMVFGLPTLLISLLVSFPWFLIALKFTGNPIYPIFSSILHQSFYPFGTVLKNVIILPITVTFPFDDFLSPMVGLLVMLSAISLFSRKKIIRQISMVGIFGSLFSVSLNPASSRYLLPYLPAIVISAVYVLENLKTNLKNIFIYLTILSSIIIVGLRCIAVKKYLPFVMGRESQNSFLTKYAGRLPDTFIDSDNFVENNIPKGSKILIDKLHNLYYFPFDFDHTSWVKSTEDYDYLVTSGEKPEFLKGSLLNTNSLGIKVYKLYK